MVGRLREGLDGRSASTPLRPAVAASERMIASSGRRLRRVAHWVPGSHTLLTKVCLSIGRRRPPVKPDCYRFCGACGDGKTPPVTTSGALSSGLRGARRGAGAVGCGGEARPALRRSPSGGAVRQGQPARGGHRLLPPPRTRPRGPPHPRPGVRNGPADPRAGRRRPPRGRDRPRIVGHNVFRTTGEDGVVDSELRFRDRAELPDSLLGAGFTVEHLFGERGQPEPGCA